MCRVVHCFCLALLVTSSAGPSLGLAQQPADPQLRNLMTPIPIGDVSLAEDGQLRGVITTSQMSPGYVVASIRSNPRRAPSSFACGRRVLPLQVLARMSI